MRDCMREREREREEGGGEREKGGRERERERREGDRQTDRQTEKERGVGRLTADWTQTYIKPRAEFHRLQLWRRQLPENVAILQFHCRNFLLHYSWVIFNNRY